MSVREVEAVQKENNVIIIVSDDEDDDVNSDISEHFFDDFSDPHFIEGFNNVTLPPYLLNIRKSPKTTKELPPYLEQSYHSSESENDSEVSPQRKLIKIDINYKRPKPLNVCQIFADDFFDSDASSSDDDNEGNINSTSTNNEVVSMELNSTLESVSAASLISEEDDEDKTKILKQSHNAKFVDSSDFSILPVSKENEYSQNADEPVSRKRKQLLVLEHVRKVLKELDTQIFEQY